MIIYRLKFASPVALPGRAPTSDYEPGANPGWEARHLAGGWLILAPPGLAGLPTSGIAEAAALAQETREPLRLGVLVPDALVTVYVVSAGTADGDVTLPTLAPSAYAAIKVLPPAPPAPVEEPPAPPPPVAVVAPPQASRRRGPVAPAPAPPPSVGWVDDP